MPGPPQMQELNLETRHIENIFSIPGASLGFFFLLILVVEHQLLRR